MPKFAGNLSIKLKLLLTFIFLCVMPLIFGGVLLIMLKITEFQKNTREDYPVKQEIVKDDASSEFQNDTRDDYPVKHEVVKGYDSPEFQKNTRDDYPVKQEVIKSDDSPEMQNDTREDYPVKQEIVKDDASSEFQNDTRDDYPVKQEVIKSDDSPEMQNDTRDDYPVKQEIVNDDASSEFQNDTRDDYPVKHEVVKGYESEGFSNAKKIKAGYLYNFTKFFTWSVDKAQTFNYCILGDDTFAKILEPVKQRRTVMGQSIKLYRFDSFRNLGKEPHCHILYISSTIKDSLAIVPNFDNTLVVGESGEFIEQGGMIGFVTKQDKIKLQINLKAINQSGLNVSQKLLEVADVVKGVRN